MNILLEKAIAEFEAIGAEKIANPLEDEPKIKVNEAIGRAAYAYEKLRNVLDYQDEHLFLKNAIKRILKRKNFVTMQEKPRQVLHELVWARYFENDVLPVSQIEDVASLLRKYDFLREHIVSRQKLATADILMGFCACDIEELLRPRTSQNMFSDFVQNAFLEKITLSEDEIDPTTLKIQIAISIEVLLFKSDLEQLRFSLMRVYNKHWSEITHDEAEDIAKNFDKILEYIDWQIAQNPNSKVFKYIKRNIPPFIILWQLICENRKGAKKIIENHGDLQELSRRMIEQRNKKIFGKVLRALGRGIIFIFFTKIVLAFLIEVPYEAHFLGTINYTALMMNIAAPPVILTIAGIFVRIPGAKNTGGILRMIDSIITEDVLPVRPLQTVKTHRAKGYLFFNSLYSILSVGILGLVVWLLIALNFNAVSIVLFFVFISIVSFLAFRIRSTARELEVRSSEEGIITGVVSFILLPFVIVGKFLSDKWAQYNFTLWFWDYIVEMPFKSLIIIFESWLKFVREKREDFE